jgi:hypothetical protein
LPALITYIPAIGTFTAAQKGLPDIEAIRVALFGPIKTKKRHTEFDHGASDTVNGIFIPP